MTWDEIGRDSLEAAKLLRDAGRHRSSVSRAYYAAYSMFTHHLPEDRMPKHQHVPGLVQRMLENATNEDRLQLTNLLVLLYQDRLEADYNREEDVDAGVANRAVERAEQVSTLLEAVG